MADKETKPKDNFFEEVVFFLFALFLIWMFVNRVSDYLRYYNLGSYQTWGQFIVYLFLKYIWPLIKVFAAIVTLGSIAGLVYLYKKIGLLEAEERQIYHFKMVEVPGGEVIEKKNEKWEGVIEHLNSPNTSDWRLAIIEADIILEELLRASGYHGESIGEMLKSVEKSDFLTIENAWEAHKVRNQIAHAGSSYELNEREAKRVIALFESVFKEFKII